MQRHGSLRARHWHNNTQRLSKSTATQCRARLTTIITQACLHDGVGARDLHDSTLPATDPTICRRSFAMASVLASLAGMGLGRAMPARAEPTATLEQVTPKITPAGPLTDRERQVIRVFDESTYSVVNIYDITLLGRAQISPEVDVPEGNGSGVIWDSNGHIVTNYHVLGNVLKGLGSNGALLGNQPPRVARVTLLGSDGRSSAYDASLVGTDKARDLAVLKINVPPAELRPINIGSSEGLRVGQQVLAIGCPFGFDHTLTTGVVSGLNREIRSVVGSSIPGGIQTDAAINPGNSGGPLLNSVGQLVGINTAIFTNTGTSVGVGFAIPIDAVARVVPQLITSGKVTRPSLGVQFASDAVAARLKVARGALVQGLVPGGAAEKAGLLPTRRGLSGIITGDVIVQVNNTLISTPPDLTNALDLLSIGQEVNLAVIRTGDQGTSEIQVKAILGSE